MVFEHKDVAEYRSAHDLRKLLLQAEDLIGRLGRLPVKDDGSTKLDVGQVSALMNEAVRKNVVQPDQRHTLALEFMEYRSEIEAGELALSHEAAEEAVSFVALRLEKELQKRIDRLSL